MHALIGYKLRNSVCLTISDDHTHLDIAVEAQLHCLLDSFEFGELSSEANGLNILS